jgi:hypothetical protein
MFWLIENKQQLKQFAVRNLSEIFVEIIPYSPFTHPAESSISCIYIRPINHYKGYLIPIYHTEVEEKLFEDEVFLILKQAQKIYVKDKKEFLHYFPLRNAVDLTLLNPTYIQLTAAHEFLYQKYPTHPSVNTLVPIVKHYEYCESLFEELEHLIEQPVNEFYNHKATWVFYGIEQSGLFVDNSVYNQHFNQDIQTDVVYTQYNFKTLTTRPSNTFNGINYAALNKENGCRSSFIPRNTKLVEFDISAYHPTLVGWLINYDSIDFSNFYSAISKEMGISESQAKESTFRQLYGGIQKEYENIEYFSKTKKYIYDIWEEFNNSGQVIVPISGYCFKKDKLDNMNPQKLFNYILQNLETSYNICILWEIFKILKGKNTKLVMYTYDAFLFDWDSKEVDILYQIENILSANNLHYKVKNGKNYDF